MIVDLITSTGPSCGIAAHSRMLSAAVEQANPSITVAYGTEAQLDPANYEPVGQILHLNYHRGLHSRWTPDVVAEIRERHRQKVVITFHDTFETQPDDLPWRLADVADAMIVHEPCDLSNVLPHMHDGKYWVHRPGSRWALPASELVPKIHYWRQGVPHLSAAPVFSHPRRHERPIVGTLGHDFPWKNYDLLCEAAKEAGWGVLIISPNATAERRAHWRAINPYVWTVGGAEIVGVTDTEALQWLRGCDATAFLYTCANSGTSGAIRFGIAVGKPILAGFACRQFRDLALLSQEAADRGKPKCPTGIIWTLPTVKEVAWDLSTLRLDRFDPAVVALREKDSWNVLGQKYADLYQELLRERTA